MELRNQYIIYIGILVLVVLIAARFRRKKEYKGGKRIAGMSYIEDDPYYKRKLLQYKFLKRIQSISGYIALSVLFVMLARPYRWVTVNKDEYKRDIILCMDVSDSVTELNGKLVEELQTTVKELKGERFGIVIFNSSSVMLSPLTDDYAYILDVLEELKLSLASVAEDELTEDWLYRYNYIMSGTVMSEANERGSSLIGDGLATSVYNFQDMEEERTRIIIFSTDNDLQGEPIVTLDEAADICKKNHVTVFGVGTKEMLEEDMKNMKKAMEKTGGKFYLEEESGTMKQIVKEIEKEEKSLTQGKQEAIRKDIIVLPFCIFLLALSTMLVCRKIIRE